MPSSAPVYPPVKFKFGVAFQGASIKGDTAWMEISGLNYEFGEETISEGGVLDRVHKVPTGLNYPNDLVLKRGMIPSDSSVRKWLQDAVTKFQFTPIQVQVNLLDSDNKPLMTWVVYNAWPKKYEVDSFNSQENSVAVETLTLAYSRMSSKN